MSAVTSAELVAKRSYALQKAAQVSLKAAHLWVQVISFYIAFPRANPTHEHEVLLHTATILRSSVLPRLFSSYKLLQLENGVLGFLSHDHS